MWAFYFGLFFHLFISVNASYLLFYQVSNLFFFGGQEKGRGPARLSEGERHRSASKGAKKGR